MRVLIYLIVISDPWMVLCVQSCACCDCNSSCHGRTVRENPLKPKEPRRSQRNRTRSSKQAFQLAIPCNILKYRTSKKRKRTPKDGWNLWCNFYVCNSCPHPYQRLLLHTGHSLTPMGQNLIFSNLTQRALHLHEPHVTGTILRYFAYLHTVLPMVLHFNIWVAKH